MSKIKSGSKTFHMEYEETLFFKPIFDYYEFFKSQFLCDCEVVIHDDLTGTTQTIPAHILVLSNSSDFFYNAFTADMEEAKTGVVHIYSNPDNLIPRVIEWMYNGKIDYKTEELIPLLHITSNYGITELRKQLVQKLESIVSKDNLLGMINQCYELELETQLDMFVIYLAKFYKSYEMRTITTMVDCTFFGKVLKEMDYSNEQCFQEIKAFLGDAEITDEDREGLCIPIKWDAPGTKALIRKYQASWVPASHLLKAL